MSKGILLLLALAMSFAGCSRQPEKVVELPELIERLADRDFISQLGEPDTDFIASTDPTGGNNDYNNYLRLGPPGWWVLADLKGPGYVSRFWFTGGEPPHRIRLYFDNEKTPRIDSSIGEFCGGMEPFVPPLAAYANYCFYNYVPLTYRRRLIVMVEAGATKENGWPRVFYQINYTAMPRGWSVKTFTMPPAAETIAALREVAGAWSASDAITTAAAVGGLIKFNADAELNSAVPWQMPALEGPAVIRELRITPDFSALPDPATREHLLRDVIVRIRWDDLELPSVVTPLGDFGGSVWRRTRYQSMFFGMTGDTWIVTFPMPFAQRARLELLNQSDKPIRAHLQALVEKNDGMDNRGYFHAVWHRSGLNDVGRPHVVLETDGCGRFAGCLLSTVSFDNSFWLLEGDEIMWRDGMDQPFWAGTGLEDYFTGGWYYQNILVSPLHGLPLKNFFRTVQYRVHLPDVINFKQSFRMIFERGPDHASRGIMESLAWYYLEQPRAARPSVLPSPFERRPPENPLAAPTVMIDILNYERFDDYVGAREFIDIFLAEHPDFPHADLLRLRQAAYVEWTDGIKAARPMFEKFALESPDSPSSQQARMLLDYHDNPQGGLLGFNANMPTRVFLDGKVMAETMAPEKLTVIPLELAAGRHVLAVQCRHQNYPDWMQLYLQTHAGAVFSNPEWRHAVNPPGAWWLEDYDDSRWARVGGTGCKGPPEEPYIFLEPNGFVGMQSQAIAVRPSADWPSKTGTVVYRRVFDIDKPEQKD